MHDDTTEGDLQGLRVQRLQTRTLTYQSTLVQLVQLVQLVCTWCAAAPVIIARLILSNARCAVTQAEICNLVSYGILSGA
jgi:hypothetical protein